MHEKVQLVRGIDEEETLMGTCACASPWRMSANAVLPNAGRWLDLIRVVCPACGSRAAYVFDVTRFFVPRPGIWGRRQAA